MCRVATISFVLVVLLPVVLDLLHLVLDLLHEAICEFLLGFRHVIILELIGVQILGSARQA